MLPRTKRGAVFQPNDTPDKTSFRCDQSIKSLDQHDFARRGLFFSLQAVDIDTRR